MEKTKNEKEIYKLKNVELKQKTIELEKSYENIKIISKIGQSITSTLDLEEVLNTVYENINTLMDAQAFGIGIYHENLNTIEYKLFIDRGDRFVIPNTKIYNDKSLAAWCIKNKQEVLVNDLEKDYSKYLKGNYSYYFGKRPESLIFYPLIVENSVVGIVTVQSYKKNAYRNRDLDMIKALAAYIAIAVRNAQRAEKLSDLSQLDGLTEIPNRRRFDEVVQLEWMRAKRYSQPISLLIIDIDNFKSYNDNYGHLSGDKCIKRVAKTLVKTTKRAIDFVGRYGGDEFIAILPNTDSEGAILVAEHMRRNIGLLNIEHMFSNISDHVTITVGCSTIMAAEAKEYDELIMKADKALYAAKEKGRNRVEVK